MRGKRILAFLLAACMVASPIGGGTAVAADLSAGASGLGMVAAGGDGGSVSDNNQQGISLLTVTDGNPVEGTETFEDESIGNWGMTGDLAGSVSIKGDAENKWLQLNVKEKKNISAVKTFSDVPTAMKTAEISFKWYTGTVTSTSRMGNVGIQLLDGGTEIVSLYVKDMRKPADTPDSPLYYSMNGYADKQETGSSVTLNTWYDVKFSLDFTTHTATVLVDGSQVASGDFNTAANKIDQFGFATFDPTGSIKVSSAALGIDDFAFTYEENSQVDDQAINSLADLPDVNLTKAEYEAGYRHPTTVTATLINGETVQAPIDGDTWTSTPVFDVNAKGWYTWTADLTALEGHANPQALKASYKMAYKSDWTKTHDYEEDFTFDVWETLAWGKEMDSESGTGSLPIAKVQEADGNYYMRVGSGQQNGERGNRLDIKSGNIKESMVQFDVLPLNCTSNSNMELMFVSPDKWNSYFTLRFDSNYKLSLYTKCSLGGASTEQAAFEGAIDENSAIDTGLSGNGKWFTVKLAFNYAAHSVDVEIFEKGNESNKFTQAGIPLSKEANGLNSMVVHLDKISGKPDASVGLDNIKIDLAGLAAKDIASIEQPKNVMVAKNAFDSFEWPTEVSAKLGDGSEVMLKLGEWTPEPVFDKDKEADYVWTAPLILGELTNPYQLTAAFTMTYTLLPYPLYAHNPNTLELKFGEPLPAEFPKEVMVFLSDGTTDYMPVDEWQPIRAFNAAEEGIYVYGANLKAEEGKTQIVRESLIKNENHEDQGSDKAAYIYDVYYRISYFETKDNFNAYQRSMEYLDRGVYAIASEGGIFVSWRLLATEYGEDISFNIYRNGSLVNTTPITDKTNYMDAEGKAGDTYTVAKLQNGTKAESAPVIATEKNYLSIPLQKPDAQPSKTGEMAEYTINDAGVADVDGDGEYEIIVKWYPTNAFDSGKAVKPSSPTIFDVYKMDGTPLWRLNLGLEMPSGAHFNQFMFYDLDEDGKAELFIKTSDGSITYRPNAEGRFDMTDKNTVVSYIGDVSVVPGTNIDANGHVNDNSNEYVTVFNGLTGAEISTIDFVNTTGNYEDWHAEVNKNDKGNRSARYNIAIAYLPKEEGSNETVPAVLFNRGYYAKTTVAAYTLKNGTLNLEWNFVAESRTVNAGKGNHNMSTGDLDNDGYDELVIGALAIDHDGSVLWVKDGEEGRDFSGHADTIHVSAMFPDSNQLYVMTPSEDKSSTLNYSVTNAATGVRVAGIFMAKADIGRGIAANITPNPGFEFWANIPNSELPNEAPSGAIYNVYGDVISQTKPVNFTTNSRMYWDGDLLSELPDSSNPSVGEGTAAIFKYNWENNTMDTLATFEGTKMNNSTKNNPCLTADLFGDWREEIMVRDENNSELRIYMTDMETDYMIYTLMHDPVYRNGVANQNTSYNQPPHLSYYLGEDIADEVLAMQLPVYNIRYTTAGEEAQVDKDALKAALESAAALKEADYSSASWANLKAAMAMAQAQRDSSEATVESVAAALNALNAAVQALEAAQPDGEPDDKPDKDDTPDNNNSGGDVKPDDDVDDDNDSAGGSAAPEKNINWGQINADLTAQNAMSSGNGGAALNVIVGNNIQVPSSVFQILRGKNTTLALHTGNNLTFSLSGSNVTSKALNGDLNLTVCQGEAEIPAAVLNEKLKGAVDSKQISMENHENFGMMVNMHLSLKAENAGNYANLYRYNEQSKRLEYMGSFQITKEGQALFGITKGAEYLVTVTKEKPAEKAGGNYIVGAGDTLSGIAAKYGVTVSRLLAANPNITNANKIRVGQNIYVK